MIAQVVGYLQMLRWAVGVDGELADQREARRHATTTPAVSACLPALPCLPACPASQPACLPCPPARPPTACLPACIPAGSEAHFIEYRMEGLRSVSRH